MATSVEVNQASINSLLLPVPKELVLLRVPPSQKPTPAQIAEFAAASEQNEWAYGIEEATAALTVFPFPSAKPKSNSKSTLLILENEEAVEDAREMGIAAIAIPASFKNSVAFVQKVVTELRDDKLSCLVYLGTGRTETIKQACVNAGVPFVALTLTKLFSPLPDNPTIGDVFDRMNPSQFIRGVENLLQDAALGKIGEEAPLSLKAAAEQAREILKSDSDELTINIQLEKVREACGMSSYDWERKIIKPLKQDLGSVRFKLELLGLLQIDDPIERMRQQALLAPKYQMSSSSLEKALGLMKQQTSTPEVKVYDIEELLDLETQGMTWLIPEMLPAGETIILAAPPKAGKTLLAIDAAFAVATGEGTFLGETTTKGKVLIVEADESLRSTKSKLLNRGFRRQDRGNVRILPKWNISQMGLLEKQLEDFRPDLVIVDSLRRINHGSEISENDADFADNIYTLSETLQRYGAAGILIHHSNKDRDAQGVHQLRGSSAIAGAVWGTWLLESIPKPDPNNKRRLVIDPKDPNRVLSIFSRDCEGQKLLIELNPENNSWSKHAEAEQAQKETIKKRILEVLIRNSHKPGLTGTEIIELLGMTIEEGRGVYQELSRMTSRLLISCKPAPGDKRQKLYSLPKNTSQNPPTPPPPPDTHQNVEYYPESIAISGLDNTQQDTQQTLNKYSTTFDDLPTQEASNPDISTVVGDTQQVQQKERGGCVECDEELDKNSSPTPENEFVDCGAGNSFTEEDVEACIAQLKLAVEENDPRVGNATLVALTTLPELLKKEIWGRLSTDAKAEIKRIQRQAEAKVGNKCEVQCFGDFGDAGGNKDVSYVWKPATLVSLFDKSIGQSYWIFDVEGKNIPIHGRDEWRLIDETQKE